jgi:FtsP/CotA-like multicopper oxidase with cupredoxin domain
VLVALLLVGAAAGGCGQAKEVTIGNGVPVVVANDNRVPAGRLRGDTLTLRLVVQKARWFPESDSGVSLDVPVFAEEGRAPQIPGPLVRVERGTMITLAVRNGLPDSTLWLHGFMSRPAVTDDSVAVKPGATTTIQFAAGAPGTYIYWARAGLENFKDVEREQLAGAFVVDSANGRADDRVLVINIWGQPRDSVNYRNALAINGKSWPHNERLTASVGDSVHWRVVNASAREHPMHLHGFYYRVDARGSPLADTSLAPAEQRQVVTEVMPPGGTMSIVWSPDRPGNWLFHCHIGFHVLPDARLDPPHIEHDRTSHDPGTHMSGLVLGISVKPSRGWRAPIRTEPRRLRLFVQEGKRKGRALRALGYVLQQGPNEPALDSVEISGSQLVLTRGEPSDITVINRLREATAIHWHGIELESYCHRSRRFIRRATDTTARRYVHVPHASERLRPAHVRTLWPDRGARAGKVVRPAHGPRLHRRLGWPPRPTTPPDQRGLHFAIDGVRQRRRASNAVRQHRRGGPAQYCH